MYLKELSIKGFKSFADPATLELEPGVTVVVGPNGSGKSNVVDAIAWVLGAQAPSSVRSQKMDDVIFAGTAKKQALGRAQVSLTIDNSDGQLDLEFTEITISRTLFRTGESEYTINGVECRLLDIQELLSDSGVGKQQHVIVSQGQIDDVLNARPEDRRSIIEEAAGILKYRKRRERAERRLASTFEDLNRLQDLNREIKRQIKPLEKQAEAAEKYQTISVRLNELKTYLAGRQLSALNAENLNAKKNKIQLSENQGLIKKNLGVLDSKILNYESDLEALGESDIADILIIVNQMIERIKGLQNLTEEKTKRLKGELGAVIDENLVSNLEAETARLKTEIDAADLELELIEPEFAELELSENQLQAKQLSFDEQWNYNFQPSTSGAGEIRAQVDALEKAVTRGNAELERLNDQLKSLDSRVEEANSTFSGTQQKITEITSLISNSQSELVSVNDQYLSAESKLEELTEQRRVIEADLAHWKARHEALGEMLSSIKISAGVELLESVDDFAGVFIEMIEIDPGWENAINASLGDVLSSLVVDSSQGAINALDVFESVDNSGSVAYFNVENFWPDNPQASIIRSHVSSKSSHVSAILDAIFSRISFVEGDWRQAYKLATENPEKTFVTIDGDFFAPGCWKLKSANSELTQVDYQDAADKVDHLTKQADGINKEIDDLKEKVASQFREKNLLEDKFQDNQSLLVDYENEQKYAQTELSQCESSQFNLNKQKEKLLEQLAQDQQSLKSLSDKLPELEVEESNYINATKELESSRSEIESHSKNVAAKRSELEVRKASIIERQTNNRSRLVEVESRLEGLNIQRNAAQQRRIRIENEISEVESKFVRLEEIFIKVTDWQKSLQDVQRSQTSQAKSVSEKLSESRRERSTLEKDLTKNYEETSRLDILIAQNQVRVQTLTEAIRQELEIEPSEAMELDEPSIEAGKTIESEIRDLENDIKRIGVINPLAVEEFAELQERYQFLSSQLEDVKNSRKDLITLIDSIDSEIVSIFSEAYSDVAENFKLLFNTLFPGGRGSIKLVNDEDLLNCGVEIEAKPSGKNVKKLSLLSGGERSLVALAFLFAVFKSRPSPFYVMDEVEAALDDMNLSRFLNLVGEFRKETQLIIISHQKRTMESADVLYGVAMKPGGSSKVISEKVQEPANTHVVA